MGDVLEVAINYAERMGWLPVAFIASALLLAVGIKGFSALRGSTDTWDEILRIGAIALIVASAIALVGAAIQYR